MAAAANETLTNVTINFLVATADGKAVVVRSLVLTSAQVVAIEHYTEPDATGAPVVMEQISFNFQKYTWTENAAGVVAMDSVVGPLS
jgi:type VI protein secretion system component Hcp